MLKVPAALSPRLGISCLAVLMLGGCTGLGMWLYEDPHVNLVEISMPADTARGQLQFVLAGCNTNDYDLQLDSLVMLLEVGGRSRPGVEDGNSLVLPSRASIALPIRLLDSAPGATGGTFQVPFSVTVTAKVLSPTGPRYISGTETGVLTMKNDGPVSWNLKGGPAGCRPGGSKLPPAAGRGVPIVSAPLPPSPPRNSPSPGK